MNESNEHWLPVPVLMRGYTRSAIAASMECAAGNYPWWPAQPVNNGGYKHVTLSGNGKQRHFQYTSSCCSPSSAHAQRGKKSVILTTTQRTTSGQKI